MAYPFAPMPSFGEFRARLEEEFGCSIQWGEEVANGAGEKIRICRVTRSVNGKVIRRAVQFGADDEILTLAVLRSVCARLEINPHDFGLTLD